MDRKHTVFGRITEGINVLAKMENVETDGSNRPLNKIVIKDIVVFIDPFAEFQEQRNKQERLEERQREIRRQGGTEDDKTTWTGKRIRADGTVAAADPQESVGKYLKTTQKQDDLITEADVDDVDTWEEPQRKKTKVGGFGNFDAW